MTEMSVKKQLSFKFLFYGIGIFFWHSCQCNEFRLGKFRVLKNEFLEEELQTGVRPV